MIALNAMLGEYNICKVFWKSIVDNEVSFIEIKFYLACDDG